MFSAISKACAAIFLISILLIPPIANAQTLDRISLLDNFGDYDRGDHLFIYGNVASISHDSFLIVQIINPDGDICKIEQLTHLNNGIFLTEAVPLTGSLCGISGEYQIKIFYGDYSKTVSFFVNSNAYDKPTDSEYFDSGVDLVSNKLNSLAEKTTAVTQSYYDRLDSITTNQSDNSLADLEQLYIDLWLDFFLDEEIYEVNPTIRPAISELLEVTSQLVEDGILSFDVAEGLDEQTISSLFYYEIGNTKTAVDKLNDVFVSIKNVDPVKVSAKKAATFSELEELLQNIMTKTGSVMNRQVKEELAFIFSRGTVPLYANELEDLRNLLKEARLLDITSRNSDPLYRLIQTEWETKRASLTGKTSITELLESKDKVNSLYEATLLLRQLDDVERFISDEPDEDSELANLIRPEWDALSSKLELATSSNEILEAEKEINDMKDVIDISSRISKVIEISQDSDVNSDLINDWESLLDQVAEADSVEQILEVVSEFDESLAELREKQSPINVLTFEYEKMKAKAELQADYDNLVHINNALRILDTAKKMEDGNPSVSRIDRIDVLLTWAAEKAPEIKKELDSYTKDAHKVRAGDILQRAQSVENLVELGLNKNRFLPGYVNYTNSVMQKIDEVRSLVIKNDLDAADIIVRALFDEWQQVSSAYAEDPYGSESGYNKDELIRIEYRERLQSYSDMVSNFYNAGFEPHEGTYNKLTEDAYELIDYGNFVDAETKTNEIGNFLSEHLTLSNDRIIYDIKYDGELDIWLLDGYVEKDRFDRREELYVTVYNMDSTKHSYLEFMDTKHGRFYTQWEAPAEPGLYVAMLQYQNDKASQIVHIEPKSTRTYNAQEYDIVELSREFEELRTFIETFGGENYEENSALFSSTIDDIKRSLSQKDTEQTSNKLSELQRLIERYLPDRSRTGVIEAQYENDKLVISGAVQKTISFEEELFVDIFDQQGNLVEEIVLTDSSSGHFSKVISKPFKPGMYVAQLNYHDLQVSDFFTV